MSAFINVIPAQPGWRVATVWKSGRGFCFGYEEVIAWAETADDPGTLVPVRRDGFCEHNVCPLARDDGFLAILAPGQEIHADEAPWNSLIERELRRQEEQDREAGQ